MLTRCSSGIQRVVASLLGSRTLCVERCLSGILGVSLCFFRRSLRNRKLGTDFVLTVQRGVALFGQGRNSVCSIGKASGKVRRCGLGVFSNLLFQQQRLKSRNHIVVFSNTASPNSIRNVVAQLVSKRIQVAHLQLNTLPFLNVF